MMGEQYEASRKDEIKTNLSNVQRRIDKAVEDAGSKVPQPELIVVTKFHPASDVQALYDLGVRDVGENRDPEGRKKAAELPDDLRWHFIGQLQTNKAKFVARYADAVHSLDRVRLVHALDQARANTGLEPLKVLVQVDLDPRPEQERPSGIGPRGGVAETQLHELVDAAMDAEHLELKGVMAVAPLGLDPTESFERLKQISQQFRERKQDADWVSAGMSGDLEQAVAASATHLRIGTDVLGQRGSVN